MLPGSSCLSAAGIGFLGHPVPAGGWAFLAVGLPEHLTHVPDPVGITTFHTHEIRPGWVPPVSRGRRCSPSRQKIPDRRLPLHNGQPLHPTHHIPSGRAHA